MRAVDTNILVYAFIQQAAFHDKALKCITELAEGDEQWAIPWPCIHEFLAITTNPKLFNPPIAQSLSIRCVEAWLDSPSLALIAEDQNYFAQLKDKLVEGHIIGGMVHDARIAALCIQAGVTELLTADRDFSRFTGLRIVNPLV